MAQFRHKDESGKIASKLPQTGSRNSRPMLNLVRRTQSWGVAGMPTAWIPCVWAYNPSPSHSTPFWNRLLPLSQRLNQWHKIPYLTL